MASNPDDILKNITNIDPDNEFIKYIVKRVQRNDYRGWHVTQHNRLTTEQEKVKKILEVIQLYSQNNILLVPPGDHSHYISGYKDDSMYTQYIAAVDHIHEELGAGTFNSIKKNIFPDLERMGFVYRGVMTYSPDSRTRGLPYLSMTAQGKSLCKSNIMDGSIIFHKGVVNIFNEKLEEFVNVIHDSEFKKSNISIYEFMFIFSDVRKDKDIGKVSLLKSYRRLKKRKRDRLIELIKEYANPNHWTNKKHKRDFGNWKNEIQQMMGMLKRTLYFEVGSNRYISLNFSGESVSSGELKIKRRQVPKEEYFKYHGVNKLNNFELHHIVPLSQATSDVEVQLVDDYKNLIYISKSKHKEFRKKPHHIHLDINSNYASFSRYLILSGTDNAEADKIKAINDGKEARYSSNQVTVMSKYNNDLLKSLGFSDD